MAQLIWYEWKKILGRRVNQIALTAGAVLMFLCVFNYIRQNAVWNPDTKDYVRGVASFAYAEEKNAGLTDVLTEEFLREEVKRLQSYGVDLGSEEAYTEYLRTNSDLWGVVIKNYAGVNEYGEWSALNDIGDEEGIHFYETRRQKIEDYLNMDFSFGNYTEGEKAFWLGKADGVETPFLWGSKEAMGLVWDTVAVAIYAVFILIVCVTPVFSEETESGAAALLLTTKKGRRTHVCAKIMASVSFAVLYQCLLIGAAVGTEGLLIGFAGADLPVQLWKTACPYDWTAGEAVIMNLLILLLVTVAMVLFTLLLSARLRNSIGAMAVSLTVMIAPVLFPMSKTSRLWNHMNCLFPVRVLLLEDNLELFMGYGFGRTFVSLVGMIFITYAAVSLLCLGLIGGGYTKYQPG